MDPLFTMVMVMMVSHKLRDDTSFLVEGEADEEMRD